MPQRKELEDFINLPLRIAAERLDEQMTYVLDQLPKIRIRNVPAAQPPPIPDEEVLL